MVRLWVGRALLWLMKPAQDERTNAFLFRTRREMERAGPSPDVLGRREARLLNLVNDRRGPPPEPVDA
jgi:hypothetical protein